MKSRKFVSVLLHSEPPKGSAEPGEISSSSADVLGETGKEPAVGDSAAEQASAAGDTPACVPQFPLLKSTCSNNWLLQDMVLMGSRYYKSLAILSLESGK